jgi:hypothetical protein
MQLKVNIRGQAQEIVKREDYNFTNLITSYLSYRKRKEVLITVVY